MHPAHCRQASAQSGIQAPCPDLKSSPMLPVCSCAQLSLAYNQLEGTIPNAFATATRLQLLSLAGVRGRGEGANRLGSTAEQPCTVRFRLLPAFLKSVPPALLGLNPTAPAVFAPAPTAEPAGWPNPAHPGGPAQLGGAGPQQQLALRWGCTLCSATTEAWTWHLDSF